MRPNGHRFSRITFHNAQSFQPFTNHSTGKFIHLLKRHSGLQCTNRCRVCGNLNVIHFSLTDSKRFIRTNCRRHITSISHFSFRTSIHQQHIPRFHRMPMIMVMQSLSAYRGNSRKRKSTTIGLCHRFQCSHHFPFLHSYT